MRDVGCEKWRDAIAMYVLGELSPSEETGLSAHFEGCASCSIIEGEFRETVNLLGYVHPGAAEATASVSALLAQRVLGELGRASSRERRRRTISTLTGAGALVVSALLAFALVGRSVAPSPVERTLALHGSPSVHARVVLSGEPWGTSVDLRVTGLPGGQVYTVSMRTSSGVWWIAGTYRSASGAALDVTMACAVAMAKITAVRVVDASGATVLSSAGRAARPSYAWG